MKTSDIKPTQGALLLSEPFLKDFYFSRSVVLLAEHNETGTFGLIINKPLQVTLNEIVKDFPYFETNLYIGGPVNTESLFVLHTVGSKIENSYRIMPRLYWGGNMETIKAMIEDKKITNDDIRFYIGYSGWDPNQLDREMKERSWAITKARPKGLFFEPPADMWKNYLKAMGSEYAQWVNYPPDPIMN